MFKRVLFLSAIIAILFFSNSNEAFCQRVHKTISMDTTKTYKIYTIDKSEFTGKFLSKDSVYVKVLTSSNTKVEIPLKNIKNIEVVENPIYKNGDYWFENPNASRYFFSSSAINLKKGKSYYQNTYIFLNSFATGISNNFSVAAGVEFLTTFSSLSQGGFHPVYFVSPKLGFDINEKLHLGVGYFYTGIFSNYGNFGSGLLYGVVTLGDKNNNFSLSAGFNGSGFDFDENPIIGMSASIRVSKGVSLITDNIAIPTYHTSYYYEPKVEYYPMFSYGIRIFGEKLAVDLALLNNLEFAQLIPIGIPYVDFVVNF